MRVRRRTGNPHNAWSLPLPPPTLRERAPAAARPLVAALLAAAAMGLAGCRTFTPYGRGTRTVEMLVTAYCPCAKCCGWVRNAQGTPVFASGPLRGKPKTVGVCADGSRAGQGTVAADTGYYPFGTRLYVPGYGYGTVRDRGGGILGPQHIDVFFKTHRQALEWGRQVLRVTVFGGGPPR